METAGILGVISAIDGMHIKIIATSQDEDGFVNWKKLHSINTRYNILHIVARINT